MKKILIVVSALVAVMLCSCKKDESGQTVVENVYSVNYVESSFRAMVGHSDDIKAFGEKLYALVNDTKFDSDSAAKAAVGLLVAQYDHQYITGNFTLCKGREGGATEDLENYQLTMMKYSVSAVIERPVISAKNPQFNEDSIQLVKDLDSVITLICSGEVKEESAIELQFAAIEINWNDPKVNKGNVLANYWFFRDNDTVASYAIRLGKGKVKYIAEGYESMTGRTSQIDSLKNDLDKALKVCSDSGFSSYDVYDVAWNAAKTYQKTSLNGYLYIWQHDATGGTGIDNALVRQLLIKEIPGENTHARYLSISFSGLTDVMDYVKAEHKDYLKNDKTWWYRDDETGDWKYGATITANNINEEFAYVYASERSKCVKAQDSDNYFKGLIEKSERWVTDKGILYENDERDFAGQFSGRTLKGELTFTANGTYKENDQTSSIAYKSTIKILPMFDSLKCNFDPADVKFTTKDESGGTKTTTIKSVGDTALKIFKAMLNDGGYEKLRNSSNFESDLKEFNNDVVANFNKWSAKYGKSEEMKKANISYVWCAPGKAEAHPEGYIDFETYYK